MNAANIIRAGGLGVAVGFALLAGPAALASAAPSAPDQNRNVAPAGPSAHAVNRGWLGSIDKALNQHIAQLQAQQAHLAQADLALKAKMAQEQAAIAQSQATVHAAHVATTEARTQLQTAEKAFVSGSGTLPDLETAIMAVQQLRAQELEKQFSEALRPGGTISQEEMLRLQSLSEKHNQALEMLVNFQTKQTQNLDTIVGNIK